MLEGRIENAEDTFMNGLSQAVYGDGSVTGTIGGLGAIIASSPGSGTVGGIDRGTWNFWRNIAYSALTNGGAAATSANITHYMNSLWKQIVRGSDKPDLIVADGNYFTLYWESLQAIQRITGSTDLGEAGFDSLKYMNSDVVLDGGFQGFSTDPFTGGANNNGVGGAPANTMYMLEESVTVH